MKHPRHNQVELIVQLVSERYGIRPEDVYARARSKTIAHARGVCVWLARHAVRPQPSLPEIGRAFRRDHTTIMLVIRTVERRIADDPWTRETIEGLKAKLAAEEKPSGVVRVAETPEALEAKAG